MSAGRYKLLFGVSGLLFLFLLITYSASGKPEPICGFCRRVITKGEYISVGEKHFHAEHFFCDGCSKSLVNNKFYENDGKFYCEKCFDDKFIPVCDNCEEKIYGESIKANEKIYHKICYDTSIALRCSLCQRKIIGEYAIDFWGNNYHLFHEIKDAKCAYCGRFISESISQGGFQYDDGRSVCGICIKSAVEDDKDADKLMSFIIQKLKNYGIEVNSRIIELQLIDQNRLARISKDSTKNFAGLTTFEGVTVNGQVIPKKFNIYILHGMPRENIKSTLTHELMHVWLYSNAPLEMDPALTEGSCNYASYLLLQNSRDAQVSYLIDCMEIDTNIFYVDGFRRVKKMVRRMGVEAWLEYLKSNISFPPGY